MVALALVEFLECLPQGRSSLGGSGDVTGITVGLTSNRLFSAANEIWGTLLSRNCQELSFMGLAN